MSTLFSYASIIWNLLIDHLWIVNLLLAIIIVFFQRRDPKAVWTWLLVLFFVPVFGFIFYLILGQDYRKSKMFRVKEAEDRIAYSTRIQENIIKRHNSLKSNDMANNFGDLVLYNLEAGSSIMTVDNTVDIFTCGDDKFNSLIEDIRSAKKYIHIQYYIIKNDELWDRISGELIKKAGEGVEVRVLYDGMGGRFMPAKKWRRLTAYGIKVGEFFPAMLGKINLRLNYRNHRKMVIIDGRVGYVGGFNIGREYIDKSKKFGHWRDTHLRLTGDSVTSLQSRFALDWNYATHENLFKSKEYFEDKTIEDVKQRVAAGKNVEIQIITSGPDSIEKIIRNNYIALINKAKEHIYIQTPYFIPDDAIMTALVMAARSGVDVRLMIPCMPDHPFVYWATYSWAGSLLAAGARVYTYMNGFLHAKTVEIDGLCACVGTANMDIRSFELNFEVNATIYDKATSTELKKCFEEDLPYCKEITAKIYKGRGLIIRIKEQISRLLSPLL